ncbi:Unknown protein [Striga hermonthica]|uniref:DUF4057 domain-containing protein n=1 Tax=Striga hermonthica TaxID=68872 RepID=A0A9N7RQJ5_STRHE|nr:Unknown protein [Striga hermonthica]
MDKRTPMKKPHTSTADLLTWSENPPESSPATARSHLPSDGISKVVFGGQVTDEEVESLNKRKPCSGYKMKEMSGSGIFKPKEEDGALETEDESQTPTNKTGLRMYQQALAGVSHISFGEEETVSLKKPTTLPEVAKQRELSGNLESESEAKLRKQISDAKNKELSGNGIFAPPPEIQPRPLSARALALRESITFGEPTSQNGLDGQTNGGSSEPSVMKTSKKIPDQKFSELLGNNIFKGDGVGPTASAEKPMSSAKLREMSGSNIFADGKSESRDYFGGVRKPPGGESSIALI